MHVDAMGSGNLTILKMYSDLFDFEDPSIGNIALTDLQNRKDSKIFKIVKCPLPIASTCICYCAARHSSSPDCRMDRSSFMNVLPNCRNSNVSAQPWSPTAMWRSLSPPPVSLLEA